MQLKSRATITGLIAFSIVSANAAAQCDCTNIVGSCQATAVVADSFIEVSSNAPQCSRVDYLVDGIPLVTLIVEGEDTQGRMVGNGAPSIIIQGCQVCRPVDVAATEPFGGSGLYTDGEVTPLIEVSPIYPQAALDAGIEGFVELQFVVDMSGTVSSAEVVAAQPAGVFDRAALDAIGQWRYTRPMDEPRTVTERLEFNLATGVLALRPTAPPEPPAVVDGPRRNNCMRENGRYDFGSMIDISLVNACSEPLLVYSCTAGTGTLRGRWICLSTEESGNVVGAARIGGGESVSTGDRESFAAIRQFDITRAPNSEYWLMACPIYDEACRSDGREWVRSLHRQMATVNPQDRTRVRLARSY